MSDHCSVYDESTHHHHHHHHHHHNCYSW